MKFTVDEMLARLPLPATDKWKDGVWDLEPFQKDDVRIVFFAPRGVDYQTAHDEDEFYFIVRGSGELLIADERYDSQPAMHFSFRPASNTVSNISLMTSRLGPYFSRMANPLIAERVANALVIRFNRPEIRNSLSIDLLYEIDAALNAAVGDVDTFVFTGTGDVFASGANLREIAAVDAASAPGFAERGQRLMVKIAGLQQTTIAAVNGHCYGGALDFALACDIRIASPTATFCHPGAGLGIITGWGGTQRLPRLVGRANALEMFFTAAPVTAERALQMGLVDAIENDVLQAALRVNVEVSA